jgi:hypothetical protein
MMKNQPPPNLEIHNFGHFDAQRSRDQDKLARATLLTRIFQHAGSRTKPNLCDEYETICFQFAWLCSRAGSDTAPERQSGRKAQISNITAAKVCS